MYVYTFPDFPRTEANTKKKKKKKKHTHYTVGMDSFPRFPWNDPLEEILARIVT